MIKMDTTSDFLIFNMQQPQGQDNDDTKQNVWDSTWTTEQMRESSHCWSLGGDSGLLNRLQEIAQKLTSQTHRIQSEVNSLSHEAEVTNTVLNNVNNEFLMLSNCQFVESRVYDEEVSNSNISTDTENDRSINKSKEDKETELIHKISKALKLGISVIDKAYEHIQVRCDSDSEEEESYHHEPILHPKDPYSNRPLPYIIGSELFYSDNKLGIFENLSEDELPDDVSIASSKGSDDFNETNHQKHEKNGVLDDVESYHESDIDDHHSEAPDQAEDSDIFNADTDNDDQDNLSNLDDNVLTSTLKTNFDKELSAKLRPSSSDHLQCPTLSGKKPEATDVKNKRGGNSDDLFSTLIDAKQKTSDKKSGNLFDTHDDDDLFGKDGLFSAKGKTIDSPENDVFFKSETATEDFKTRQEKQVDTSQKLEIKKPVKLSDNSDFKDNLFDDSDDENDLFATASAKTSKSKLLFDKADRDFENKTGKSGSGSNNISRSNSSTSIRDFKKDFSVISASSSDTLFVDEDDGDDLFKVPGTSNSKSKSGPSNTLFSHSLDNDFEDIFAPISNTKFAATSSLEAASSKLDKMKGNQSEGGSTNNDDDDDLFSQAIADKQNSFDFSFESKSLSSTTDFLKTSSQFNDEASSSKSLFEVDDDEFDNLFKSESPKQLPVKRNKQKQGLLDVDDDLLFGPSTPDSPDVNLFSRTSKNIKMKDEIKNVISVKASDENEVSVKLEEKYESNDVFVVSAEPRLPVADRKSASGDKISKLRSEIENKLGDQLRFVASPETFRRKPVGGVSVLGPGLVPGVLNPQRSPSPVEKEEKESTSNAEETSRSPVVNVIIAPTSIDVNKEESISFDDPVEANVLHNANKVRAKIQVKRRPQTRKARQEKIRNSTIDIEGEISNKPFSTEHQISSVSAPTSPMSFESEAKPAISSVPVKSDKLGVDSLTVLLSPSTDEEDLFVGDSRQPTIPPLKKGSASSETNLPHTKLRSSSDNLFGDSSDDGESETIFTPKSTKTNELQPTLSRSLKSDPQIPTSLEVKAEQDQKVRKKDDDDDLFGKVSKPQKSISAGSTGTNVEKAKKKESLFDDDDDDDDLFKASSFSSKNKMVITSKKTLPPPAKTFFDGDDDNDLFEDPLKAKKQ